MFKVEEARELLQKADVFFDVDDDDLNGRDPQWKQALNMNDVWGWACADVEFVTDEQLPQVAELFWRYGWCGILYWVSEQNDKCKSAFHDVNRQIEFVRNEEVIRAEIPGSSERAYTKRTYTIGAD